MILSPGRASLSEWRAIYRGAVPILDSGCRPAVEASAAAVAAIVARGEAVYGINTGFGKLAQVRIAASDLATLQRNIVLSHAAGVGEPLSPEVVRLVLALKLGSLARGASGVRWPVIATLEACLARGLLPRRPVSRFGRRLGRPRAARAHDGGADGRRRVPRRGRGVRERSNATASRRWNSARRRAWRCSTARR